MRMYAKCWESMKKCAKRIRNYDKRIREYAKNRGSIPKADEVCLILRKCGKSWWSVPTAEKFVFQKLRKKWLQLKKYYKICILRPLWNVRVGTSFSRFPKFYYNVIFS